MVTDELQFKSFVEGGSKHAVLLAPSQRRRASPLDIHSAITKAGMPHSGDYYKMSTMRVLKHAFDVINWKNGTRFPACESSSELWDILLQADSGAKEGARRTGLLDFEEARKFVCQAQKAYPSYCLCDLSCWLCLAKSELPPKGAKRKHSK